MQPLITVYITNFNYGSYIEEAIASVFKQTYSKWELIIIDDGSTDNSKQIIDQYIDHPSVKIIYQKNRGLNVTNNIALRIANGKYIMRLDADDYLDQNALLVMSNSLEQNDHFGLVFPDYFLVDADGNILNIERRNSFKEKVLLDQPAHGACTMIRKSALESVGGYDEEFGCQDGYELWVKFTAKFEVANIETPLFYYRQHGNNLTTNENRILDTRARIKEKFISRTKVSSQKVLAIVPVRESKYNANQLAFKEIDGTTILRIKIEALLKAKRIDLIVVSSPDEEMNIFIKEHFPDEPRLLFHKRDKELTQLNTGLGPTIENVLEFEPVVKLDPSILLTISIEYPFSNAVDFDDAINTLTIFQTDSLISVRKDNNVFYQHHGDGMKSILGMDKFSKLEREILYQYAGGIIATQTAAFKETKALINGTIGHIVIPQKSAFRIQTDFDLAIAQKINAL